MLKKIAVFGLVLALAVICSSCGGCEHEWTPATCTDAKFCSICNTVEGEALGHSWTEATYEAPKTCSACGLTEGEPLFDPAYSEENILASEAIQKLQPYIDFLIVSEKTLVYDEENRTFNLNLTPKSGAANAYSERGDQWGLYTAYLKYLSSDGKWFFYEEGLEVSFCVTLFDDRDGSTVLYEAENGLTLTDVYSDIVPKPLKSLAFEDAFVTLYHNYGSQYEITAEYNEYGEILYFYIRLDSGTSMLFNSLPSSELAENKVWKSLTETFIRWSGENFEAFLAEGHNINCVYFLIDGNSLEDAFYAALNGEEFFSFVG